MRNCCTHARGAGAGLAREAVEHLALFVRRGLALEPGASAAQSGFGVGAASPKRGGLVPVVLIVPFLLRCWLSCRRGVGFFAQRNTNDTEGVTQDMGTIPCERTVLSAGGCLLLMGRLRCAKLSSSLQLSFQ